MAENNSLPPLKALHSKEHLIKLKLMAFGGWTSEALVESLCPPRHDWLKARTDGTDSLDVKLSSGKNVVFTVDKE